MLIGTHYETLLQQTARFRNVLIVIVLITSITILYQYIEEYQTTSWFSSRQTLFYIQKVALCLLVLSLFHSRESSLPAWMKMLGTYAFAIYFLHVIFIDFLIIPLQGLINEHRTWAWITALGFGNMFVGIGGSIISAWLLQRLFKGYSKQIVGA
jgi:membrane-bound acyltransferase YfiQ involved in biofilm formation